jgi:hypothetical protein
MEDSEVKTQIADIQEQSVAPVTKPEESVAAPTGETASAEQPETKGETEKGVSSGVQKRIDQMASKVYMALDEKKQAVARVKELEEENARLKSSPAKEVSMFEEPEADDGKAEVARLKKTVDAMEEQRQSEKKMTDFTELFGELREKYPAISFEESMHIVEELNKDDVPPQARGVVEKYFVAHEAERLRVQLQDKEAKQERKQAVTEGKTVVSSDHLPDDDVERLHLLTTDPAKYEELAKKSGLRG